MHRELHQLRTEKEQTWREITLLKRTEEKSRAEARQAQTRAEKLQADLEQAQNSLACIKFEADKLKEAMRVRDDEVSFLRGHVSQLTQTVRQLALPPSQEEAKKKGWWQFWR
jgi:predicted nuclease with TOPRIM domain